MIHCSQCGRIFDREAGDRSIASISGSIMGDEYIESYYFCTQSQVYTVEIYHDRFLGEEEISVRGPVVAYMPRYRAPFDWILFLLAGSLVWRAMNGFRFGQTVDDSNHPFEGKWA